MKQVSTYLAAGGAVMALATVSAQSATLYEHTFDGPAAGIDTIAPDTVVSGSVLGADHGTGGTWSSNGVLQNGTGGGNTSALLTFSPKDGYTYTFEITGSQTTTDNNWFGGGFTTDFDTVDSLANDHGVAWGLSRPGSTTTTNRQVAHFDEAGGTGLEGTGSSTTSPSTITIVLDTTAGTGSWDVSWFLNDSVTAFATKDVSATAEANIDSVGVGFPGTSAGQTISSFSLTVVPEPGSLALLAAGSLCVLRRRRG